MNEFGDGLIILQSGTSEAAVSQSMNGVGAVVHTVFGGDGSHVVNAGFGDLLFVNGSSQSVINIHNGGSEQTPYVLNASSVFGGTGSITVTGATPENGSMRLGDIFVGGSAGNNVITTNSAGDTVVGGGNNDTIYAFGADVVLAGPGAATVDSAGHNVVFGGSGPDALVGLFADTLVAGSNQTFIRDAASLVQLGTGQDIAQVLNDSTVIGGAGASTVEGTSALVFGGSGPMMFVDTAPQPYAPPREPSSVYGGTGAITVQAINGGGLYIGGSNGANSLSGGIAAVTLVGGGSGDVLSAGGALPDILIATAGNETLIAAGTGNDVLLAGAGQSFMAAGSGSDLFVFSATGNGASTISGFKNSSFGTVADHVGLNGFAPGTAANALAAATISGGSTTLQLPDQTRITFANVTGLTISDFQ